MATGSFASTIQALKALLRLPCYVVYRSSKFRSIIDADIERWRDMLNLELSGRKAFFYLVQMPEFRSLLYYRIPASRLLRPITGPESPCLYLNTKAIGPGLYLQHAFATIVHARGIGRNCSINQQVTIGFSAPDQYPTIGDNVTIRAGAKVIGEISIGSNVVIGAGAVVTKNVPPDCTVVGVPAYIVKRGGKRCRIPLE